MKPTSIVIFFFLQLSICLGQVIDTDSVPAIDTLNKQKHYSEGELAAFLDSIGNLNPEVWVKELSLNADSALHHHILLNKILPITDFEILKKAALEGKMDTSFAKKVFQKIDSEFLDENKLPINFYSFDKNASDFKKFAISIGYDNGLSWENDLYFFNSNKIISKHEVFHREGLELKHFNDEEGRTIVYYIVNYGSGTGVWWYQFNFYSFDNEQLVPVLTEIKEINLQYPWSSRPYFIESRIINERPLKIKFVYSNQFFDTTSFAPIDFIDDSSTVTYQIDKYSGRFVADFNGSKLNQPKLLSYFHSDTEFLFINAYHDELKDGIESNNNVLRQAILDYLAEVKHYTLKSGIKASDAEKSDCEIASIMAQKDFASSRYSFHSLEFLPVHNTYVYVLSKFYNIQWYFTDSIDYFNCYDSVMISNLKGMYGDDFLKTARSIADSLERTENWISDAEFPGGKNNISTYILTKLAESLDTSNVNVNMIVQIEIDSTGKVTNPAIRRVSNNEKMNKKIIDIIKQMPDWKPAYLYGIPIRQTYSIPVIIQ